MTLVGAIKTILFSKDDNDVEQQPLQNFLCKMFIIGRAICFVLAVVLTVIAAITNSQGSNRRVPPIKPFFARETWVDDFYKGELYYALLKGSKYDIIFLMLYAPWDADSQNARNEFETTCRYYHEKIYCAAVNCWQANAGCKAFYNNIPVYPVFLVDLLAHNLPSIKYNGEYVAAHMIRFLSTVVRPFERIHSFEKFELMRASCDALLIAYLPNYKWYNRYYAASLKFLEYDPRRDVCWSIVTDTITAQQLHMTPFTAKMYTWNGTKEYNGSFGSKDFIKWAYENTKLSTHWLSFKNARSSLLSDLVVHNTAVILFTPRNMFLENIPSYLIFKEVSLELKKCNTNATLLPNGRKFYEYRRLLRENYDHWQRVCAKRFQFEKHAYNSSILESSRQYYENFPTTVNSEESYLCETYNSVNRTTSSHDSRIRTSMLDQNKDEKSPRNLVFLHVREKCRQLNLLKRTFAYSYLLNKPEEESRSQNSLNTPLCHFNNTVTLFAVDSLLYSHFAASLGINLDQYDDRTTVAIFDNRNEETFVLKKKFDKNSLTELLIDYFDRTLFRWKKSTANATMYLNRYNKHDNWIPNEMTVVELNSDTFHSFIFNSSVSQHAVIYYYSPYCTYCQVSAHVFLSVANMLKNFTNIVFARIDSENNDLLWYLTPQIYPTIIIFPAKRKSESIMFPQSLEITTETLFEFILSNVDAEIKLKVMIDECNEYRNLEHKAACLMFEKCITNVKTYCLQLIDNLITKYKSAVRFHSSNDEIVTTRLQNMLDRLKYLKSVYFSLEGL